MKILLDTQIILWALSDDKRLSSKARKLIEDPENTIYVSVASIWELQIKNNLHPDSVPSPYVVIDSCRKAGYEIIEIKSPEILRISELKYCSDIPHKDPFDRIILSTAKTYGFALLTADSLIPNYREKCVISC